MKIKFSLVTIALGGLIWFAACKADPLTSGLGRQPNLPDQPYSYALNLPPEFGVINSGPLNFIITPEGDTLFFFNGDFSGFGFGFNAQNPNITDAGATLGRVLFYDPQLSLNNRISCASCHKQELAFSDGKAGSVGFEGKVTPRNSMAILNAGFNNNLFWDSRVQNVNELATKPIQNHIEMGMEEMANLERKLSNVSYYPALFEAAFGSKVITEDLIGNALAQFVCAITTTNSRFDAEQRQSFVGYSQMERMGHDLFFSARTNCARCHAAPNFAAPDFAGGEYGSTGGGTFGGGGDDLKGAANNGLDLAYADQGLGEGRFRIPSLRNIALTAPYMHDGRFNTLEQVIDHYDHGIQPHHSLDKNLRNADGSPKRMNLNSMEKLALIAFLHTLTDETLLSDPRFSDPFRQ
ncbi:MAG: hypothetical protein JNL02_04125 [Saprospiraceae bacterium]|nr:hypothetical protein [Saprospiraceae bacterium]